MLEGVGEALSTVLQRSLRHCTVLRHFECFVTMNHIPLKVGTPHRSVRTEEDSWTRNKASSRARASPAAYENPELLLEAASKEHR